MGLTDVEMDSVLTLVLGHVTGAAREAAYDPEYAFELGLRRGLDGVGVLIDSRA